MPNWCTNEIEITTNNLDQLKQFLSDMGWTEEEYNTFSFDKILPIPDELKNKSWAPMTEAEMRENAIKYNWTDEQLEVNLPNALTPEEAAIRAKHKEQYGADNWYDWCIKNWGTKWEPTDIYCDDWSFDFDWSYISFSFETAWGPPESWVEYVNQKYPDLSFDWFYKEPGTRIAGWL